MYTPVEPTWVYNNRRTKRWSRKEKKRENRFIDTHHTLYIPKYYNIEIIIIRHYRGLGECCASSSTMKTHKTPYDDKKKNKKIRNAE